MGVLGTILSIVPTVAGIVGNLFGVETNDYIKFKMYQSSNTNKEPDIYFVKTADNKIMLYNSCGYPVHVSMENAGVESDEGYIVEDCGGGVDVTDLIASHSAKYVNKLRLSINVGDGQTNGPQVVSLKYSGKIDRDIEGSVCIGKYASVEILDDDLMLVIHSDCTLKEISSLVIKGEGSEPERCYENVSPDAIVPELSSSISISNTHDVKTIAFPKAVSGFVHSNVLEVEVSLLCEMDKLEHKSQNAGDRRLRLAGPEWDFLRTGCCLKEC